MAIDALSHAPVFSRQSLGIFDLPVTFLAGYFTVNMTLMIKQDMFGHIIHFDPGGGGPGVEIAVLYLDPRMIGDDVIVAMQAFFHRRYSRVIGIRHVGMAILALYLLYTAVDIVTERDRLFRTTVGLEQAIV